MYTVVNSGKYFRTFALDILGANMRGEADNDNYQAYIRDLDARAHAIEAIGLNIV